MESATANARKEEYEATGPDIHIVHENTAECTENMHTYWQERSKTFGFDMADSREIAGRARPFVLGKGESVLDVGTGTGVVAAAFASLGCKVTAVDLAENMIKKAEENLAQNGFTAEFSTAQADELPFEDNTFDMLVNRNLTWALAEPEKALIEWRRVLKPGGVLLYFDADQYTYLFDKKAKADRDLMIKIAGGPHKERSSTPVDYSLCDNTAYNLPLSKVSRPGGWDETALPDAGFVILKEDIDKPQNLLKFGIAKGFSNHFMIVAKSLKEG